MYPTYRACDGCSAALRGGIRSWLNSRIAAAGSGTTRLNTRNEASSVPVSPLPVAQCTAATRSPPPPESQLYIATHRRYLPGGGGPPRGAAGAGAPHRSCSAGGSRVGHGVTSTGHPSAAGSYAGCVSANTRHAPGWAAPRCSATAAGLLPAAEVPGGAMAWGAGEGSGHRRRATIRMQRTISFGVT